MTFTVPRNVLIVLAVVGVLAAGIGIGAVIGGSDDEGNSSNPPEAAPGTSDSAYVPPQTETESGTTPEVSEDSVTSCDELLADNKTGICEGKKAGSEFKVAYLDQTVTLDTLDAKVESVTTADEVGQRFIRERANGIFVIVTLAITNKMSRPQSFSSFQDQTALNVNDNLYNEDFDAENQSDQRSFLSQGEDIGPGITQVGNVIYDVPQEIADNVLSPRTDAGVIISEFTRPRARAVGALILRHQK